MITKSTLLLKFNKKNCMRNLLRNYSDRVLVIVLFFFNNLVFPTPATLIMIDVLFLNFCFLIFYIYI